MPRKVLDAMDAATLIRTLASRDGAVSDDMNSQIGQLLAGTTEAEKAGLITTLRRGASLDQARDWLGTARKASRTVDGSSYELALNMYGDSTLLGWDECLQIAPALTYRSEVLEAAQAGLPSQSSRDGYAGRPTSAAKVTDNSITSA